MVFWIAAEAWCSYSGSQFLIPEHSRVDAEHVGLKLNVLVDILRHLARVSPFWITNEAGWAGADACCSVIWHCYVKVRLMT